jgi:hypothetical protein
MRRRSVHRNRLFELLWLMTPVIGTCAIMVFAWFLVFFSIGEYSGAVALVIVPFLAVYSLLFLIGILGMDISDDPEPKDDLDHLLSMKRTTGFPIQPPRGGVRRFARPPDDLIDGLFQR